MTWTLVEEQINLDAEIDPSVFTISPAKATRIHDVQQNRKAIEAVRPAAACLEESRPFRCIDLRSLAILQAAFHAVFDRQSFIAAH
jgi:hypothetical protein